MEATSLSDERNPLAFFDNLIDTYNNLPQEDSATLIESINAEMIESKKLIHIVILQKSTPLKQATFIKAIVKDIEYHIKTLTEDVRLQDDEKNTAIESLGTLQKQCLERYGYLLNTTGNVNNPPKKPLPKNFRLEFKDGISDSKKKAIRYYWLTFNSDPYARGIKINLFEADTDTQNMIKIFIGRWLDASNKLKVRFKANNRVVRYAIEKLCSHYKNFDWAKLDQYCDLIGKNGKKLDSRTFYLSKNKKSCKGSDDIENTYDSIKSAFSENINS